MQQIKTIFIYAFAIMILWSCDDGATKFPDFIEAANVRIKLRSGFSEFDLVTIDESKIVFDVYSINNNIDTIALSLSLVRLIAGDTLGPVPMRNLLQRDFDNPEQSAQNIEYTAQALVDFFDLSLEDLGGGDRFVIHNRTKLTNGMVFPALTPLGLRNVAPSISSGNQPSFTVSLPIPIICTSTGLAGDFESVGSGLFGFGGTIPYSNLSSEIEIEEIRPGLYMISDMTFGVYEEFYDDDPQPGRVNLCDDLIFGVGDTDTYGDPFTINGKLNEDGSATIVWSNTYGDSGEVTLTPK
ncbi:MAG: hypothetical protein ACFCUU_11145 [Cyclobacteriaceae bacterium]